MPLKTICKWPLIYPTVPNELTSFCSFLYSKCILKSLGGREGGHALKTNAIYEYVPSIIFELVFPFMGKNYFGKVDNILHRVYYKIRNDKNFPYLFPKTCRENKYDVLFLTSKE